MSAGSGEKCGDLESLYGKTMVGHLLVAASECLGNNGTLSSKNVGAQRMMSRMFDSRLCSASDPVTHCLAYAVPAKRCGM